VRHRRADATPDERHPRADSQRISSTALAAIHVALWDLAGVRTGTPLYQLLGAALDRVRLYNTHVGWLNRPFDEPGHGIRFDDEALDRFTVAKAGSGTLQESR
jgi:hypothetical protein